LFYLLKKKLTTEQISLARLALSKEITQAIEKIKVSPKIAEHGWKHTFIQYKSRSEKRKSWKEKTKQLMDIENKLKDESEKNEADDKLVADEAETKDEDSATEEVKTESLAEKPTKAKVVVKAKDEHVSKAKPVKKAEEKVKSDDEDIDEDDIANARVIDGDDSDAESDISMNSADYDNFPNKDLAEEEDEPEEEESQMSEEEKENEEEEEPVDISKMFVYSRDNLENKTEAEEGAATKKQRTHVIEANKPAHMEIKQLNLDEIQDFEEIPIESKQSVAENGGHDGDEQRKSTKVARTVKVEQDPFFLDKDGREIEGNNEYTNNRYNRYNNTDEDNFNENYDDKRNFNNKKFMFQNSSFKNSLSSSRDGDGYRQNSYARRGGFNDRGAGCAVGLNNNNTNTNNGYNSQSRGGYNNNRGGASGSFGSGGYNASSKI
jgi:hypothetical protein